MQPLSGLDAAFLSLETDTTPLHVGAVLVLDPPEGHRSAVSPTARFAQIRRMIEQRVHLVRQFRQRVLRIPFDLHHPVWVDDEAFDLDNHVRRASLPAPGGPRELDELVAELMSRPLDPGRPLWEMVVVEGLESGRTALVAKLHHAILDGVSGAALLASFLESDARERHVDGPDSWEPEPGPAAGALLRNAASGAVHRSAAAIDALGLGLEALSGTLPALLGNPEEGGPLVRPWLFSAPRSSINGTISSRRSYASTSVALDDVELVRRAFGTTLNDVVLAAVGGAVRRLLESRSDLPDRSLVALVPVSTRRRSDKGALGNRLSGMLVALRTDTGETGARLSAIGEVTRAARARHLVTRGRMLDDVVELSPAFAVSRAVRWAEGIGLFDHLSPPFNLVVSYVSGPSVPLWCAGGRVVGVLPAGPVAAGVGLNITVFSYLGRLWFGLLGCRRLLPEVQDLAIMVDGALTELVTASGVVRPAPAAG